MLEVRSVGKRFAGVTALEGVTLNVTRGEIHAIMGENGAGKSTLIKILTGEHREFDGRITLDGHSFSPRSPRDAQDRFGIACIHQELSLVPDLSIAENLFLAREPRTRWRTLDTQTMLTQARGLLARLGATLDPRRPVRGLRTGEQQLVEIARALSLNARLLLLDEPTSALSDQEIERLMRVLEGLRAEGVTILYISHKLDEVFRLADRITVLRDGRLIGTRPRSELDAPALLQMMAGRPIEQFHTREAHTVEAEEVLTVEGLSVLPSGDARALHGISFSLRRGEVLGVAGLMGSGRTELLEALFGATPTRQVRARRLVVGGTERHGRPFTSPREALAAGFSLVTEDRKLKSLVLPLSVRHNMTLAALRTFVRRPSGWVRPDAETEAVQRQTERLRIKTSGLDVAVAGLSGGNQQKVVLARCLLTRPRVLLLDEPTRGIDVGAKSEIYRLIGDLARDGMAVLLASSEMPELLSLCDRILVLSEGRLSATLDGRTATQEQILEAATANGRQTAQPSVVAPH
jgi:ABC-type sugar transport system ATPase subunit